MGFSQMTGFLPGQVAKNNQQSRANVSQRLEPVVTNASFWLLPAIA